MIDAESSAMPCRLVRHSPKDDDGSLWQRRVAAEKGLGSIPLNDGMRTLAMSHGGALASWTAAVLCRFRPPGAYSKRQRTGALHNLRQCQCPVRSIQPSAFIGLEPLPKNFNDCFENALTFNARQTPFNPAILLQFCYHAIAINTLYINTLRDFCP
jgi:hypothetical protein